MWPIPALQNDIITFSFSTNNIVCNWMHKKENQTTTEIKAYERIPLEHFELENLILFNPTYIKNVLTAFLTTLKKNNAFVAFSFYCNDNTEKYVTLPISAPKREDFDIPHSSNILWNYHYLYQNEEGQFVFYVYKISHSLLLQYKLLAIATQSNLIAMTTQSIALLQCYKTIFGSSFRQSQLAVDMIKHNNNIQDIIPQNDLQKAIVIPSHLCLEKELPHIATSYGLFINQGL